MARYKKDCANCGKYYEGEGRKFCSTSCYVNDRGKNYLGPKLNKIVCKSCNKDFFIQNKVLKTGRKFCSVNCFTSYQANNLKPKRTIVTNCELCNKEFIAPWPKFGHKKKFCSPVCKGISQRKPPKEKRNCIKASSLQSRFSNMIRRALKQSVNICTKEQFIQWHGEQLKACFYCDISSENWEMLYMGYHNKFALSVDRKSPSLGYVPFNMVLACGKCNAVKTDVLNSDEMLEIGQKYIKPRWQAALNSKEYTHGKI